MKKIYNNHDAINAFILSSSNNTLSKLCPSKKPINKLISIKMDLNKSTIEDSLNEMGIRMTLLPYSINSKACSITASSIDSHLNYVLFTILIENSIKMEKKLGWLHHDRSKTIYYLFSESKKHLFDSLFAMEKYFLTFTPDIFKEYI